VNGTLQLSGSNTKVWDRRTLQTSGSTIWSGSGYLFGYNGATWNNTATGTIDLQSDADFYHQSGTTSIFNNAGTLTKSVGSSADSSDISAIFNNTGTVNLQQGTLALSGGGNSSGTFAVQNGSTLHFSGGNHTLSNSSVLTGAGKVRFGSGTTAISGAYNITGATEITGGTANFISSATVPNLELVSGGTLTGTGTLTANNFLWSGGTHSGSGSTLVNGTLQLSGSNTKVWDRRTLQTSGSTIWSGSGYLFGYNGATWNNTATGTIDLQSDADFYHQSGTTSIFNNAGTLTKSVGSSADSSDISAIFNNTGTVNLQQGTLSFANGYTQTAGSTLLSGGRLTSNTAIALQGGSLSGFGTITGNVFNASQINPGLSTGILNISGNYTQAATGVLNIELGGRTAGTTFDQLNITGSAALNGTLNISLLNGFTPNLGDTFQILHADSLSGSFTNVQGLNLGNGLLFVPTIVNNNLVLTATQDTNFKPGTLSFSNPEFSVNEDGTPIAAITVFRTGGSDGIVNATITPSNGTATSPTDYDATPIVVNFAPGETSKTVTIPIANDSLYESNETINLTLGSPTGGATIGVQNSAVLTIIDDDAVPGTLAFSDATFEVNEDGTPVAAVTVTRTGGSDGAVSTTVYLSNGTATSPGDYDSTPITVNFANGETSKTIAIPLVNDAIFEGNETVNLFLSSPTGGASIGAQSTATLTLIDNEVPVPAP
jgi:hypothetical protein